jgi:DNA polymerase-1
MTESKLLLIDAHALIVRAYHAIRGFRFTGEGEQTNAVFGFAQMLLGVLDREMPTNVLLAFEGGRTYRHEIYPEYKGQRKPQPEELLGQLARCKELALTLGIPCLSAPGFEADDVIGVLATQAKTAGLPVVIITGDHDLLGLVTYGITVMLPSTAPGSKFSDVVAFDPNAVRDKYGFDACFMADYKALAGDTSDNIPGVTGIGPKAAVALITKSGSVETMLADLAKTPNLWQSKEQALLRKGQAEAVLYKKVTSIRTEADPLSGFLVVARDSDFGRFGLFDRNAAIALFKELEMDSLVPKLLAVGRQHLYAEKSG